MVYRGVPSRIDVIGKTFGRLVVEGDAPSKNRRRYVWCRCECGTRKSVRLSHLTSGATLSCGCLRAERHPVLHGEAGQRRSPEYEIWCGIRRRCLNEDDSLWPYYGGRGIRLCERWRESFVHFVEDVGRRPSPAYQLDRIDNDGHYEPGNVRWATRKEQCRNRRSNRIIEYRGQAKTLAEWSEELGHGAAGSTGYKRLWGALKDVDWNMDEALRRLR